MGSGGIDKLSQMEKDCAFDVCKTPFQGQRYMALGTFMNIYQSLLSFYSKIKVLWSTVGE